MTGPERTAKMARAPYRHGVRDTAQRGVDNRTMGERVAAIAAREGRENPVVVRHLPPSQRKDPSEFRLAKPRSCTVCKQPFHPRNTRERVCDTCR